MFSVSTERSGDVVILQCHGRIVRGDSIYALRDAVTAHRGARIFVLDLSCLDVLDGSGLGMLVFLHEWILEHGGQLKLVNPNHFVSEMLDRTRLTCVFDVSSVCDAVMILRSMPDHAGNYAAAS